MSPPSPPQRWPSPPPARPMSLAAAGSVGRNPHFGLCQPSNLRKNVLEKGVLVILVKCKQSGIKRMAKLLWGHVQEHLLSGGGGLVGGFFLAC